MSTTATKNQLLSQIKLAQSPNGVVAQLSFQTTIEESEMTVTIEIPGVNPAEVSVHSDASILYVECERGSMSLPIEPIFDTNDVKAEIQWGLLTLRIPRRASRAVKVNILDAVPPKPTTKATPTKFTEKEEG